MKTKNGYKYRHKGKLVSRQYIWQLKKLKEGKCVICGDPRSQDSTHYCETHAENNRITARNYERKLRGIPLNAPLWSVIHR